MPAAEPSLNPPASFRRPRRVDDELDEAFDRLLTPRPERGVRALQVVIPGETLGHEADRLASWMAGLVADFEDIDALLERLDETHEGNPEPQHIDDAIAFVSPAELADPRILARAVEPLQDSPDRLDLQFAKVRRGLDRLDVYRLSRIPSHQLMILLQQEENLDTLQHLDEFLQALSRAADAFEELALPGPHIRDYLRHLSTMPDWQEMGRLVRVLETAVQGVAPAPACATAR